METHISTFDEHHTLHKLKHFLPAQAPLKDFIHHNTLHAFQNLKFHTATHNASEIFGYKTSLSLSEYRDLYAKRRISEEILDKILSERKGRENLKEWKNKMISEEYNTSVSPRIGKLRAYWKKQYHIDLDSHVHPILFRIICSYLDQGISTWNFPVERRGFLFSLREIERVSMISFFKTPRAREIFLKGKCEISDLLKIVAGDDKSLYEQYLFDQQFAHQGWSGMVATIEMQSESLLDKKNINLHDVIIFELLLEIDALDFQLGEKWLPLGDTPGKKPTPLFADVAQTELSEVISAWQDAFEWTYYDEVLAGIKKETHAKHQRTALSFQAMFCIDDRECSLRRYLEKSDTGCETFGTPGFFGVEFYYKPDGGKFMTKLCPAPVTPKYLIKEVGAKEKRKRDVHFTKHAHSLFRGWLISQTIGYWSAFRLFLNVFRPAMSPATASSFRHMDKYSQLAIENKSPDDRENGLQVGFTIEEMADRVEGLLRSIGLVKNFARIVYVFSHGASSVNNTYYAGYDCGACCGRPGSVNARVVCSMANYPKVRALLRERGIDIPAATQFLGGLHDTTRDEIAFFDEEFLAPANMENHRKNRKVFEQALDLNAKERSRRFDLVNTKQSAKKIHEQIKLRSVSLFEPRPEYNHATNALCVVGKRSLTQGLFLDRRCFMNSYDHTIDPDGKLLFEVMKPLGPVCGGINLEYFFSRVDNQKLGAGSKLPHNVMGLFGVANGADGDLRPGLPGQMIEIHDPVRLLVIVEHHPEVVLQTIQKLPGMYEWFINEWVNLVVVHPGTKEFHFFRDGAYTVYVPVKKTIEKIKDLASVLENHHENLPVYSI